MKKRQKNELKPFVKHLLAQANTNNEIYFNRVCGEWVMTIKHNCEVEYDPNTPDLPF